MLIDNLCGRFIRGEIAQVSHQYDFIIYNCTRNALKCSIYFNTKYYNNIQHLTFFLALGTPLYDSKI